MTEPADRSERLHPWGWRDPADFAEELWPVLEDSRSGMAAALYQLKRLDATPAERAALIPALRRRAVLDAAQGHGGTVSNLPLGIACALLLLAAPTITMLTTGTNLTTVSVLVTHLWYVVSLLGWIVASGVVAIAIAEGFDRLPRWLMSIIVLTFAATVTAGLVMLFARVRDSDSSLLTAVFAAWWAISLVVLAVVVQIPLTEELERRRHGALGLNASAALVLFEEWQILVDHQRNWRTGAGRRDLARRLGALAKDAETQLERSARVNTDDGPARLWAEAYLVKVGNLLRDHRHHLLLIEKSSQYEELIRRVRATAVDLADGRWGAVGLAGYQQRPTLRRRLLRFVPALGLGLAAWLVGYIPGIDQENLLTIRLTLVIPAILSLLKVGELSQSTLGDTLREAADRVKG